MTDFDPELFDRAVAAEQRRAQRTQAVGFVVASFLLSPAGWFVAGQAGLAGRERVGAAFGLATLAVVGGLIVIRLVQWIAGGAVRSFVAPGGAARAPVTFSKAQSLAAAGLVEDASREFDLARAAGDETVAMLRAEAELHLTASGDPSRAEVALLKIRRAPKATLTDELYASHRLIDLYLGPLADEGRVMVELRRMAHRFPDQIDGQGALAELRRRRGEHAA